MSNLNCEHAPFLLQFSILSLDSKNGRKFLESIRVVAYVYICNSADNRCTFIRKNENTGQ